ncbi:hypothetical protein PR202_ga31046 [Eleusine coracana subsp. coracana]|uniref:Uncharacterized protein n=1 Tax=Eleusine coracana subsp. coracana TaxID=191504 RepID=A0AAV5DQK3_ELECO|nr:hypothetical protein PR202_ga31046 [Eleusine coracana subsp. coracana]
MSPCSAPLAPPHRVASSSSARLCSEAEGRSGREGIPRMACCGEGTTGRNGRWQPNRYRQRHTLGLGLLDNAPRHPQPPPRPP